MIAATDTALRHLIFRVEMEPFALPLEAVREVVIPPAQWSRVPRAPAFVQGVVNLRGRVVTVVELRTLLGLSGQSVDQKIVLLDRGRRDLGLLVTEVQGIESIERILPSPGHPTSSVRGVARLNGNPVSVLDADRIDRTVSELFGGEG
jgi:purine-binding chemotaxis protein CheW